MTDHLEGNSWKQFLRKNNLAAKLKEMIKTPLLGNNKEQL